MTVYFDEALVTAKGLAVEIARLRVDVVIVRDILGKFRFIVRPQRDQASSQDELDRFAAQASTQLGPYAANHGCVLLAAELLDEGADFLQDPTQRVLQEKGEDRGRVTLLERTVVGEAWSTGEAADPATSEPPPNWVTFYAFKGGVGRSTAASWLAQKEAAAGKCVLVVDLDLESPGISALLQDEVQLPEHGVVDYFAESAVQAATDLDLVVRSTLAHGGNGDLWLAPAAGRPRPGYDYIAKLNRIYVAAPNIHTGQPRTLVERFRETVQACIKAVERSGRTPDLVILDSRAGIHDIAAIAVSHLSSLALLFAADTPATWTGYTMLLQKWSERPEDARRIRERLKMVSALTPSPDSGNYLRRFQEKAAACLESVYDEALPGDPDAYNPAVEDEAAPHTPLPILFAPELRNLDREKFAHLVGDPLAEASYDAFVDGFRSLMPGSF